jgi:hypothetical protein
MGIRRFYKGLVRNVESPGEDGLPAARTRVPDVEARNAKAFKKSLERPSPLLLHLAEGVDAEARRHFTALRIGPGDWAITPSLTGIHCAGLAGRDYEIFRARGGSMVWSPLSNLLLYGGTADIARAAQEDLPIALGSDWSPSGSKNLLGELKVAWLVSEELGSVFTPRQLVAMATINPARMLSWDSAIGSIEPGKRADLVAVDGRRGDPYEHLLKARETALTLVVIDGIARYGQPRVMQRFLSRHDGSGAPAVVEQRKIGGVERVLDLTEAAADPLIGALTLGEASDRLATGLRDLPELAKRLENPITASAAMGAADPTSPGMWFLELDHDELTGTRDRPALGGLGSDGAGVGADGDLGPVPTVDGLFPFAFAAAAEPLSEILGPIDLDPLTVADDERFFERLAAVPHLPDHVARGLPRLYGRSAPARPRPEPVAPEAGERAVPLAAAAAGEAAPVRLSAFLATAGNLTLADRIVLVDQALVLIEQTYVHLVLKRAMHAVDPLQRLRLLRDRLALASDQTMGPEIEFHRELSDIFTSLRDLHTNYLLPSPFRERTAYLPFLVERYVDPPVDPPDGPSDGTDVAEGPEHFIVSKVATGLAHPTFVPEVEVTHWNGTPVRRAVEANARTQAGSNPDASFARGLDALTIRPLMRSLPPDDDWVVVTYRELDGSEREIRLDWQVAVAGQGGGIDALGLTSSSGPRPASGPRRAGRAGGARGRAGTALALAASQGLDLQVHQVNEAKKELFARPAVQAEAEIADPANPTAMVAVRAGEVATTMPTVFRARPVDTPSGRFGTIRIFTFGVDDADEFVAEFVRLAEQLPQDGLVVDVRGNGGGLIYASERLLQVLTPRRITPEPTQMTTTPLMLDLCGRHDPSPLDNTFDLSPWIPSLRQALSTGAQYTNGYTITNEASANTVGQRYHGPVVLVTDALCYSATDIFAAGFQDHGIGPVLGVHGNTGAGGANVWTHGLLKLLLDPIPGETPAETPDNPFVDLPGGAGFRASVRRTLRVGPTLGGTPVEDLGVRPDQRHTMSRADVVGDNDDLMAAAGALLAAGARFTLRAEAEIRPDGRLRLRLTTRGIDRVDVALDERPVASLDIAATVGESASTHTVRPAGTAAPSTVDLTGWSAGAVVARRREHL